MNKNKLPNAVAILVLTLLTIIVWVSFGVYNAVNSKPDVKVPPEILKPLSPILDQEAIRQIESRVYLDDSQIPQSVITGTAQNTNETEGITPTPLGEDASQNVTPEVDTQPSSGQQ